MHCIINIKQAIITFLGVFFYVNCGILLYRDERNTEELCYDKHSANVNYEKNSSLVSIITWKWGVT